MSDARTRRSGRLFAFLEAGVNQTARLHWYFRVAKEDERIIEGFASTDRRGRTDGLVIEPAAWERGMADFMRNPVILYDHGMDPVVAHNPVGQVLEYRIERAGLWVRGQIAKGVDYIEERIWPLVQQGALRAFSINAPMSSIKRVGDTIKELALCELSIVSLPEDAGATFSLARALAYGSDAAQPEIAQEIDRLSEMAAQALSARSRAALQGAINRLQDIVWQANRADEIATVGQARQIAAQVIQEVTGMETQEIEKLVRDGITAGLKDVPALIRSTVAEERAADEAARKKLADEKAAFDAAVSEEVQKQLKARPIVRAQVWNTGDAKPGDKPPQVQVFSKYDFLEAGELAFLREVMRSCRRKDGSQAHPADDNALLRAMAMKGMRDVETGKLRRDAFGDGFLLRTGNELMQADLANYGDEWVPTLMSTDLWQRVRLENRIVSLFPQVEMPSNPYTLPYEGADPTVYYVAASANQAQMALTAATTTTSKAGTGNTSITAKKLSALTLFNAELEEDSIIAIIPQLRAQLARALADAGDNVVLNGDDTDTNANINAKSATPGVCPTGSKYLAFDGLRHLPLITASTLSRDGATLAATDFTANRALMAKYGINPSDLAHILDMGTWYKALDISEVMTLDKMGAQATILTGQLGQLGAVPLIVTAEMPLTGSDGKVDADTSGNNVKGTLLTVHRRGFVVGWRRHITIEQERVPFSDAWYLVGAMRIGLVRWAGSDNQVAALSYNITV